jgi:hypothetical protein
MACSLPSRFPGHQAASLVRADLSVGLQVREAPGDKILRALAAEAPVYDVDHDTMDGERPEAMIQGGQRDREPPAFGHRPTLRESFVILQGAGR